MKVQGANATIQAKKAKVAKCQVGRSIKIGRPLGKAFSSRCGLNNGMHLDASGISTSRIRVPNITLRVMVPSIVILKLEFDEPLVSTGTLLIYHFLSGCD